MIKLGYHPATFGARDLEGLAAALPVIRGEGWDGFEYSARALEPHFDDPQPVIDLLAATGIGLCGLYYTCGFLSDEETAAWLDHGKRVIEFSRAVGCPLVMIDGASKSEAGVTDEQIQRAAAGANAMGRMCADANLLCSWHQHWGTIFEYQEPFERLLALTDPELVKFTPDTAQLSLGDFDVTDMFRHHIERMIYVHFKDLGRDWRFTELGTGVVNFPALWEIMRGAGFAGWIVVDLDYTDLDPAQSCHINKSYLDDLLGITVP
jgi:sugar phosphate isomerase/epimerase